MKTCAYYCTLLYCIVVYTAWSDMIVTIKLVQVGYNYPCHSWFWPNKQKCEWEIQQPRQNTGSILPAQLFSGFSASDGSKTEQ